MLYISLLISIQPPTWVRRDSHKPPLTHPYDGPFLVLRRFDKQFTLDINSKTKEITAC